MRRAKERDAIRNPDTIISLVGPGKSLDFETDEKDYNLLKKGFKLYLLYLRRVNRGKGFMNVESNEEGTPESEVKANENTEEMPSALNISDSKDLSSPVAWRRESVNCSHHSSFSDGRINNRLYSSLSIASENPENANVPLPIRSMHPSVFKLLIAQQRQLLVDLYLLLRAGLQILKHNRTGRPKLRFLYCDVDMRKLFWRSSSKDKPNPMALEENSEGERERDKERRKSLKTPQSRRSSFAFRRTDAEREVFFEDIEDTYDTIVTDVMKKSRDKGYINNKDWGFLISIKTVDRTVDFEMDEIYFGILNHGLKILVDFYKSIRSNDA